MLRFIRYFMALGFVLLIASPSLASWAAVPLEILIDEADVIVHGKVAKIADGGFKMGTRPYDVAIVAPSTILKTQAGRMKNAAIRIGQPAAGGIGLSTDIRFQVGQEGVWILNKDPQRDVYWASHPFQFQQTKEKDRLVKLIASRKKLAGGKPVDGLVARAELVETKVPARGATKASTFYEVRISLQNVTEKPITICDFMGYRPLDVDWAGPDGKLKSGHYDFLKLARLAAPTDRNFVTIPAGGARFLGPRGKYYGISFGTIERSGTNYVKPGEHKITVSYKNEQVGKGIAKSPVWTSQVTANPVTISVK